ncbi:MAG: AraC family transcriptional regulator [Pseudomonadota bacterium]
MRALNDIQEDLLTVHSVSTLPAPAPDRSYGALYEALYANFPQKSRQIGTPQFSMIKVRQGAHATTDPAVPQIVLRSLTRAKMQHNTVDCGEGTKALSTVPGSFYIAPAHTIANWESDGAHDISLLAIPAEFTTDLLPDEAVDNHRSPLDPILNSQLVDPTLDHLIEQIWQTSLKDQKGAALQIDGMLLTLMGRLISHAEERARDRSTVTPTKPLEPKRLKRVVEYIDAHLSDTISMPDLAQVACLSQHHFARVFRAATSMSPHGYVTHRRIERARSILLSTDTPLVQVALMCGFGTQAHFSTVFKKLVGLPPKKYRAERRAAMCQNIAR